MQLRRLCLILPDDADEPADPPPSPPPPPPCDNRHHQVRSHQHKVSSERGGKSPAVTAGGGVKVDVHRLAYHASAFLRRSLHLFCRRFTCLGFGCCRPRHGSELDPSGSEFHDISGLVDCAAGRPDRTADANPRIFSYAELYIGTGGFSEREVLGSGGYGRVYRALLPSDGTVAAVKCVAADRSDHFEKTFVAELVAVAQLRHRNLVRLRGWCVHEQQLLLVYDYMPNGSLDRLLFGTAAGSQTLGWNRRRQIVAGLATALFYLHEQLDTQIIHRDVKSSNVMLDSDYGARLGDFGLARWLEHDGDKPLQRAVSMRSTSSASTKYGQFRLADTSKIGGTIGYLPPESFQRQRSAVTAKSDVFSFGIVVLEVVSGRRAVDLSYPDDRIFLLDWVRRLSDEGRCLHAGDSRFPDGSYSLAELRWLIHLALLCTLHDPNSRPTMKWALQALSSSAGGHQLPALPSFLSHPQYISMSSSSTTATCAISASSTAGGASSASSTTFSRYVTASNSTVFLTADDDSNSTRGSGRSCMSDAAADDHHENNTNRPQDLLLPAFSIVDTPREIPFKEIVALTDDFSETQMVAEMDFGTAYQGYLENRFHVLVKRLGMKTCPALRLRFSDELRNLGRLRHRHLVQLRGWCTEQGEMLVVYDYSSSGLLSHQLFHPRRPAVLPWCYRYSIVKALASAVLYLHEEWDEQVIHRSVTSSAVFLDSDKNPRLGCFALAEFLTRNNHGNHHVATTTSVRGIFGYMAPEYVESGGATTKADVYSFGVVVLEVVSGQRAVDLRQPEALLASKVRRFLASKKPLEGLLDWRIGEEYDRRQLARLARLGFLCTHSDPETRPSMRQVVSILDGNDQLLESLEGRKKEGMEEWRGRSAASLSLIRRMHALGIQ